MAHDKEKTNTIKAPFIPTSLPKGYFEICVKGHLDASWRDWLEGLDVTLLDNGEMILSGYIGDQAALMGILNKLHGLNLALLSVNEAKREDSFQNKSQKEK